jgi:shikimate dehydrogenase
LAINGSTEMVGILGDPVSHTLSPLMQNAAFDAMGLNIAYIPLRVDRRDLKAAVKGLRAMNFLGANVTIPHKVEVADYMDHLDESALITQAVNTIVNVGGSLTGYNTDGEGFIKALEEKIKIDYRSTQVLILGAGGAARSVSVALAKKGVPLITVANRNPGRAIGLQEVLKQYFPDLPISLISLEDLDNGPFEEHKLIINATPLGMNANLKAPQLPVDKISKSHVVCDLVYVKSGMTSFEAQAQEKGATTMGGLGMLIHQGAAAIHLWTGKEPPLKVMRRAIESQRRNITEEP